MESASRMQKSIEEDAGITTVIAQAQGMEKGGGWERGVARGGQLGIEVPGVIMNVKAELKSRCVFSHATFRAAVLENRSAPSDQPESRIQQHVQQIYNYL